MTSTTTRVHFSTTHSAWPWLRQSPAADGVWDEFRFALTDPAGEAEWLVVFDEPPPGMTTTVPKERRILFITEPPDMKVYKAPYANQFQFMVSPYPIEGFKGRHVRQQSALNWQYGVDQSVAPHRTTVDWAGLVADKPKSKLVSVVCSTKTRLAHHRQRLAFIEHLRARIGDRVDVFGRGFREIDDKREAIADYKYHIVLENNAVEHFWTEKLADAFLGDAFPIFGGCKNLDAYFDRNSFQAIDIFDLDGAVAEVERMLASTMWEDRRDAAREARRRLMFEHNYFAVAAKVIRAADAAAKSAPKVRPYAIQPPNPNRWRRFRKKVYGWLGVSSMKRRKDAK